MVCLLLGGLPASVMKPCARSSSPSSLSKDTNSGSSAVHDVPELPQVWVDCPELAVVLEGG